MATIGGHDKRELELAVRQEKTKLIKERTELVRELRRMQTRLTEIDERLDQLRQAEILLEE